MERLTTDNPQNNSENALNLAYAQDGWVNIRGMDESFTDYIKKQCRRNGCDLSQMSDHEVCECVTECAFSAPECPVFLLFMVATQAAELRARLAAYEDAEEQGKLLWLPCKVGDKVYFINRAFDSEICPALVTRIGINLFTPEHPLWIRIEYTSKLLGTHDIQGTLDSMLGVRLFLTYDEAEKALKEANRNGGQTRT